MTDKSKPSPGVVDAAVERMTSVAQMPPEIATALVKAQTAARAVAKSNEFRGKNFSYSYASTEDVISEARNALNGVGLAVMSAGWRIDDARHPPRLTVSYMLVHEGGSVWECGETSSPVVVNHGRAEDKAEAAAQTHNLGYFLRDLLQLPRVSETDEIDRRDDSDYNGGYQSRDERQRQEQRDEIDREAREIIVDFEHAEDGRAWKVARGRANAISGELTNTQRAAIKTAMDGAAERIKSARQQRAESEDEHLTEALSEAVEQGGERDGEAA